MADSSTVAPDPIEIFAARRFQQALRLLLEANEYAQRTRSNQWEFAVEIDLLRKLGLSDNDLRYLVRSAYVEYARDATTARHDGCQSRSAGRLTFGERACFVLTIRGVHATVGVLDDAPTGDSFDLPARPRASAISGLHALRPPVWNTDRRILLWNGQLVKSFRRRAVNQELVLSAFQEESWPPRIYDPLAPRPCQDMKRRLNDTIKCLNRGQEQRLIHFRGDGTGEGVLWEVVT